MFSNFHFTNFPQKIRKRISGLKPLVLLKFYYRIYDLSHVCRQSNHFTLISIGILAFYQLKKGSTSLSVFNNRERCEGSLKMNKAMIKALK